MLLRCKRVVRRGPRDPRNLLCCRYEREEDRALLRLRRGAHAAADQYLRLRWRSGDLGNQADPDFATGRPKFHGSRRRGDVAELAVPLPPRPTRWACREPGDLERRRQAAICTLRGVGLRDIRAVHGPGRDPELAGIPRCRRVLRQFRHGWHYGAAPVRRRLPTPRNPLQRDFLRRKWLSARPAGTGLPL